MTPARPFTHARQARRSARRGLTLVEVLVVLAILVISAGLVTAGRPAAARVDDPVTRARRLAIARAEPLVLEIADDGTWLVRRANGDTVEASAAPPRGATADLPAGRLAIDALGTCTADAAPAGDARGDGMSPSGERALDAIACRWRPVGP